MKMTEVMTLLEANQNATGIQRWDKNKSKLPKLKSYGIGLTVLRKLAKKIGRDHNLALELWGSEFYDPKKITRQMAEAQVDSVNQGHLRHVFSSCGAALAKTPFVVEIAGDWVISKDPRRRCCGYGLLYELSKSKKKSTPDENFFLAHIKHINTTYESEPLSVQGSMAGALLGIGKRTKMLNKSALKVARHIGPVEFETQNGKCEPFDVYKHLTSDYIKKKLGV